MGQLKRALAEKNMNHHGKRDTLKRRLKEHIKVEKLIAAGLMEASENRNVDYFVVIDFEATCEEKNPPGFKHEVRKEREKERTNVLGFPDCRTVLFPSGQFLFASGKFLFGILSKSISTFPLEIDVY